MNGTLPEPFAGWFAARGWTLRRHQRAMIDAAEAGQSALLIAPTGGGKTLAGFLPSLIDLAGTPGDGLHTIYVSPLKALATDIARNLTAPVEAMGLPIRIETRTGDTPAAKRQRQKEQPPDLLLTTPESLALLLSLPGAPEMFAGLRRIIVDEVHALAGTKRGDHAGAVPCTAGAPGAGCHAASACRPPWRIRRALRAYIAPDGDGDAGWR